MLRRFASPLLVLILVLAAASAHAVSARAAETALDAVTSDASIVIRMKNPKATISKVADLAELVVKGYGDQVRAQAAMLGLAISNPTLAGVNMEADWWVAVYAAGADKDPDVVFIIPASDMKAMKESLGDTVKFAEHGKLAVYTKDEDAASKTAARLKGEGKSISTLIDKESNGLFEGGDLAVFINVPQLAATYKSQIEESKEQAKQNLENIPDGAGSSGPLQMDPKQMGEMAIHIIDFLMQGLDDTQSCTIAALISKEGVNFEDLVRVTAGSATDKLLAKSGPSPLAGLSSLPAGNLVYFGLAWDMSDFTKLSQWVMGAGGAKPEAADEIKSSLAEMMKLKIGTVVSAFGLGDVDEGAVRSVTITEVDKPAKMREVSQKMMKAMGTVETQGLKQTFTLKPDAEKYGKNSADVITVKTEMEVADNPFIGQMMERLNTIMFGPDGMTTRVVYLKDRAVQTLGGGKQAMTDVLAATDKKPSETTNAPLSQTRGKLSPKANLVFLFDIANTISKVVSMIVESQMLPIPLDADAVKELQSKASYLGISAGSEPQGLRVKTHIPVQQMQGIAKIVKFFQDVQAGFGGAPGAVEEEKEEN